MEDGKGGDNKVGESRTLAALQVWGIDEPLPQPSHGHAFFHHFIRSFIRLHHLQRGRISCSLSVKPPLSNYFETLHGGGVASVAEIISTACAKTLVPDNNHVFLAELTISYLSAAPVTAEVIVDASVVKSGRNLTVVELEFKLKKTEKLIYKARSTFYTYPVAKL